MLNVIYAVVSKSIMVNVVIPSVIMLNVVVPKHSFTF
jgi:hypothetical protein